MAANVANRTGAKCLILNHFSQRYRPSGVVAAREISTKCETGDDNDAEKSDDTAQKLVDEAKLAFKGERILAAYDFFTFKL